MNGKQNRRGRGQGAGGRGQEEAAEISLYVGRETRTFTSI